jgi:hypothetical protein
MNSGVSPGRDSLLDDMTVVWEEAEPISATRHYPPSGR